MILPADVVLFLTITTWHQHDKNMDSVKFDIIGLYGFPLCSYATILLMHANTTRQPKEEELNRN